MPTTRINILPRISYHNNSKITIKPKSKKKEKKNSKRTQLINSHTCINNN